IERVGYRRYEVVASKNLGDPGTRSFLVQIVPAPDDSGRAVGGTLDSVLCRRGRVVEREPTEQAHLWRTGTPGAIARFSAARKSARGPWEGVRATVGRPGDLTAERKDIPTGTIGHLEVVGYNVASWDEG